MERSETSMQIKKEFHDTHKKIRDYHSEKNEKMAKIV